MPIVVECGCGKRLKPGDNAAGRTAKCPACGNPVTVPTPTTTANGIDLAADNTFVNPEWEKPKPQVPVAKKAPSQPAFPELDLGNAGLNGTSAAKQPPPAPADASRPTTKACPFCGEEVLGVAKKCKHCGEFLDQSMRQAKAAPKWNPGIAALLSLLLPGAGQMYQGQVAIGIVQLLGTGFAYAIHILFGAVLHLAIVIHAALANPHKQVAVKSQGNRKRDVQIAMVLILGVVLFFAWMFLHEASKQ